MTVEDQAPLQLLDPEARPLWPGFTISSQGMWHHLRCTNCGKTTSPGSLNQKLIDDIVRDHRCGPPLSTHWTKAVGLGPWYAVAIQSVAMAIETMQYGLSAEPEVRDALDRLEEAVLSHRRASDDVVEQFDRHEQRSLYEAFGRRPEGVVPARPVFVPPAVPAEALTTLGRETQEHRHGTEDGPHGPVYITVGALLDGEKLPARPGTGEMAVGVVWAPGSMCLLHLCEQLGDGRLVELLGPKEGGVVLYPGDDAPMCGECAAQAKAPDAQAGLHREGVGDHPEDTWGPGDAPSYEGAP